jgi:hypothetical protein
MTSPKHYAYMYGKLSEAEYRLAVGEGDIKSRLRWASESFFAVDASMLPPELQETWNLLWKDMTRFPENGNRSPFHETLRRVRITTASGFARRLVSIKRELKEYC